MSSEAPVYPFLTWRTLAIAAAVFTGRPRSFHRDACALAARLGTSLQLDSAPPPLDPGGWLVVVNHYARQGFHAWWIALAVTAALDRDIHWVVTGAWTYPDRIRSLLVTPASRWALRRLAHLYGFTSMPPMPPRPNDTLARALAARRLLRYVRGRSGPIVGLAPEGADQAGGLLSPPPAGSGRLIELLGKEGLSLLPVGLYESDGRLRLSFGPGMPIPQPTGDARARDRYVRDATMEAIAACLPAPLRGVYA